MAAASSTSGRGAGSGEVSGSGGSPSPHPSDRSPLASRAAGSFTEGEPQGVVSDRVRVVTYARVSTAEQVETGTSLPDQRRRLAAAVTARAAVLVEHFDDAGVSGVLDSRPGLDRLLARVGAGGVDAVMATKIDRISRSAVGLLNLVEKLREHGCHVVLIDEGLDTSTPAGDLTSGVLGVIGGWERRRISERTQQGRRAAAQNEGRFVSSTPPFGYRVVSAPSKRGKRLVTHDAQADTIRTIFQRLIVDGSNATTVAAELNSAGMKPARASSWSAASLRRWTLREPPLRAASGIWIFDGISVSIPAILTQAESAQWSAWQQARTGPQQQSRGPYLLSGVLRMPCGRGAMGRTAGTQRPTYSCRDHYLPTADPHRHGSCLNVPVDVVDAAVLEHVRHVLAAPQVLEHAAKRCLLGPAQPEGEADALEAQLLDLDQQISADSAALRAEGLSGRALGAALVPLHRQQQDIVRELRSLHRRAATTAHVRNDVQLAQLVATARQALNQNTVGTWRPLLSVLHAIVTIDGYTTCKQCQGTGFLPLGSGDGRRWPLRCPTCLKGQTPDLTIELDNIMAFVIANRIGKLPSPK
ncbi:recombinase family protein [Knoellia locipacati]|uniref:recombinase family protein n=1 Tax=Knoellia locipacati TaxID=882824 RepID=UPI00384EA3E9